MSIDKQISYNRWFCNYDETRIAAGYNGTARWEYEILDGPLCEICSHPIENTQLTGNRCGMCAPIRNTDVFGFRKIYTLGSYQKSHVSTLMQHIWANKSHTALAPVLGMALALLMEYKYPDLKEADLIVPVPSHKDELGKKGFNHTEEIAKIVTNFTKIPYDSEVLIKTKDEKMKGHSWKERREYAEGMYESNSDISKYNYVVLLDDLVTTCATSTECALKLLEAGAVIVDVLTVARNIYEGEQK